MRLYLLILVLCLPALSFAQNWTPGGPVATSTDYIRAMAEDGNGNIVASSWAKGIYRSTDGGMTWQPTSFIANTPRIYNITCAPDGNFYALANSTTSISTLRSTNGGANWDQVYFESRPNNFALGGGVVFLDSVTFVAGMSFTMGPTVGDIAARIIRSTDAGATWNNVVIITAGFLNCLELGENGKILGGTSLGGIIYSTNAGSNWDITGFIPFTKVIKKNNDGELFAGTSSSSGNSVFRSTDNGVNWIPAGVGETTVNTLHIDNANNIFVSDDNNLYRSTDNGSNWEIFNSGIPSNQVVYSLTGNMSGVILAGTGSSGVFRNGEGTTGIINNNQHPSSFELKQNYPNPFNPSTNITFSIPSAGYTSLNVYDIYGRQAASLINGETGSGTYHISFDAAALSSGTYFYKLSYSGAEGTFSETKKMVVIK